MKNSKLTTLLKTFSKEEMKRFGLFIDSPYFHTGRNLKPLYLLLKKNHPEFKSEKLLEEQIFRKLSLKEKFDKKKFSAYLRVLFTEMTKLANQFLVFEKFATIDEGYIFAYSQFTALTEKGLFENACKIALETSRSLEEGKKMHEYPLYRFETNMHLAYSLIALDRRSDASVYLKSNVLYIYTNTFRMLNNYLDGVSANKPYNEGFEGFELVKQFIANFDIELFDKEFPADDFGTKDFALFHFYLIMSRLGEKDKTSLPDALNIYYKLHGKIQRELSQAYSIILSNRLGQSLHLGRIYSEKANELFDFVLEHGLDDYLNTRNNVMSGYFNILRVKAYLFDAETLEAFTKQYAVKIPEETVSDVINYSNAFYNFKKRDFNKCLECISKNDKLGPRYMTSRETGEKYKLKICSLYELELFEDAIYAVDSFNHFMGRTKSLGSITRKENMDFIEAARNLFKLRNNENNIFVKIEDTIKYSLFGDWLIEKVNELQK